MAILIYILAAAVLILVLYLLNPKRRPLPTESDYSHHTSPWWELYYASKYLRTIKVAEKGSNLEVHFRNTHLPASQELGSPKEITIHAVGDLMTRRDLNTATCTHLWDAVGRELFSADMVIGNMEFPVNPDWIIKKLLRYSVTPEYAEPLLGDARFGRFDCVTTANNHTNDSLSGGIVSTCDFLDSIHMPYSGCSRTPDEVDDFPIFEKGGIKIAVLAYSFSNNNVPFEKGFSHGLNLVRFNALNDRDYDPSLIRHHIKLARERGADIILSSHHWGIEFEYYPPSRIVKRAHELLDAGIDIIVGHHPHILNLAEWYQTRDGRNTLCLYSLGNLVSFGLIRPAQKMALIAEITAETGLDTNGKKITRLKNATLIPTYFLMKGRGKKADHRIVPILSTAREIRNGNRPAYMNGWDATIVKSLDKEFRTYLWQEQAFTYR